MKIATGAVVALLVLTGCSSTTEAAAPTPTPTQAATFTVTGSMTVALDVARAIRDDEVTIGGPCAADDGYDDISEGTQVTVSDSAGVAVALGELSEGSLVGEDGGSLTDGRCSFGFVVQDVPEGSEIYGIEIGRRGIERYTRDQLDELVTLTLA